MPFEDGVRQLVEGSCATRTHVEYPRVLGSLVKPKVDLYHIVYVDEVPKLFAFGIPVASFEEPRLAITKNLLIQMEGHARHLALVSLTGTVDVEIP